MFNFLKMLNEMGGDLPTTGTNIPASVPVYNGTNGTSPTAPANSKVSNSTDPTFNNSRATLTNGEVTASSVTDYVNQAAEINDGVECVGFAVELDDGGLVKVYVNQIDAEGFEAALSDALGQEQELEDLLMGMSDQFDIVDVVWPTPEAVSDAPLPSEPTQPSTDEMGNNPPPDNHETPTADAVISQPETVAPESNSAAPETGDSAETGDSTEGGDSADSVESDEEDTPEDSIRTDDSKASSEEAGNDESKSSLADAEAEFNSMFGDDADSAASENSDLDKSSDDATDTSENSNETSSEPESGNESESNSTSDDTSNKQTEVDTDKDESPKSKTPDEDDDISVVIHPKKSVSEGLETNAVATDVESSTDLAPSKESKWFKSIGLRGYDEFAMMIKSITAKKLLAIIGIGGIRAAMLSQYEGLVENIITAGKKISSDPTAKKYFDTIWTELMAGNHHKSPDKDNVTIAHQFLNNIGIVADEKTSGGRKLVELSQFIAGLMKNADVKIAIDGLNSTLTGQPSNDTTSDVSDDAEQTVEDSEEDEEENVSDENDDYDSPLSDDTFNTQPSTKRTHASFDAEMKNQHSQYRKWMKRDKQVELLNWYLSGSDVHVFNWHPENGSITPHLGKLQIFAQGDLSTGEQEIICLEKPAYNISH